jgi:hypothetical protein
VSFPRARLLVASACLLGLGATTAGAASGVAGVDLDAVRGYAASHGLATTAAGPAGVGEEAPVLGATPRATCGPDDLPETGRQGRVPAADYVNGRAEQGYLCNTSEIARFGKTGGYQVHRYVDSAGRECAYYDSTLLFPKDVAKADQTGTYVLDMSDPANPVRTAVLRTPAMQSPHESLRLNEERGLLAAVMGYPTTQPGFVDVYDVSQDCRNPVLKSSTPLGILGHESGFAPDGRTFYVATTSRNLVTAIDVSDPSLPSIVWQTQEHRVHGIGVSDDGNRLYLADLGRSGLTILDSSQVQARVPNPAVPVVSTLTWPEVTIPQNVIPVTISGRPYVLEFDEFDEDVTSYSPDEEVGAGRIIDVSNEREPKVVSRIRLEVHDKEARADSQKDEPQAQNGLQGYSAHYCSVPRRENPGIVGCSMILSGLRLFDISDPTQPREVGYFNKPLVESVNPRESGSYAMSAPAYVAERGEVWYSDGNTGFYNVQVTKSAWPDSGPREVAAAGAQSAASAPTTTGGQAADAAASAATATTQTAARALPSTGGSTFLGGLAVVLLAGAALLHGRRA